MDIAREIDLVRLMRGARATVMIHLLRFELARKGDARPEYVERLAVILDCLKTLHQTKETK